MHGKLKGFTFALYLFTTTKNKLKQTTMNYQPITPTTQQFETFYSNLCDAYKSYCVDYLLAYKRSQGTPAGEFILLSLAAAELPLYKHSWMAPFDISPCHGSGITVLSLVSYLNQ